MKRILLIDDEKRAMSPYVEYLKLDGFEVDVCQYYENVESFLKRNSYDLVILDIMILPKMEKNKRPYEFSKKINPARTGLDYTLPVLDKMSYKYIILTNVPISYLAADLDKNPALRKNVFSKLRTPPEVLSSIIRERLSTVKEKTLQEID